LSHVELANTLLRQRRYAEAAEHCMAALQSEPDLPDVYCALAIVLDRLRRVREARDHENEALRLSSDAVTAHASMGSALE
jgi:Flp pilus assembly protein TadD